MNWKIKLVLAALLTTHCFSEPLSQTTLTEFNNRVNAVVNATTLFSSDMGVSDGAYKFDNKTDADLDLSKIPYTYKFDKLENGLRPEIFALYSNSKLVSSPEMPVDAVGIQDFSRLETNTFELGVGVAIPVVKDVSIIPRGAAAYSHMKRKYDFNNSYSQTTLKQYDRDAFNTSVDLMTYTPSLELRYETDCKESDNVVVYTKYSQLYNSSFSTKSSVVNVDSNSGLLQTGFEYLRKLKRTIYNREVEFRPFVTQTNLNSEAKDALDLSYFHEVGVNFTFAEQEKKSIVSEFTLGASYSFGENFSGTKLGFSLDF